MDQEKIKRSLQLLMLLAGSRKYSLAALAEKYDVDKRTIQRYLATFKSVGFLTLKSKIEGLGIQSVHRE